MFHSMHPFAVTMFGVMFATLFIVMSVAFVSIPLSLGGHPGEIVTAASPAIFHLT